MKYNIWGADFDYLPEGFIGALATDLILTARNNYEPELCPTLFSIPLVGDFIVCARVESQKNDGVAGWVSIFAVGELASRNENTVFDAYRPVVQVTFCFEDDDTLSAEDLQTNSIHLVRDKGSAAAILSALIIATNADRSKQ